MLSTRRFSQFDPGASLRPQSAVLAILIMLLFLLLGLLFIILTGQPAQAQTFKVLYNFTGGADGENPSSGLTMDAAGNLYGTTHGELAGYHCVDSECGTVFKLSKKGADWVLDTLYSFRGLSNYYPSDGSNPSGGLAIAQNGSLYGTTNRGGIDRNFPYGCGTVFHLTPPPTAPKTESAPWNEASIYRFTCSGDGAYPQGDLIVDALENVYGTAMQGGNGYGVVYELMPSGNRWIQTVLYAFQTGDGAWFPPSGVVFDTFSNLYGVGEGGGPYFGGGVYQLSPSGSGWTERTLYSFTGGSDGSGPIGGLIIDAAGNLYGTTIYGGDLSCNAPSGCGTVFELTPSSGGWSLSTLYSFSGCGGWCAPHDKLLMDAAGNLYGTKQGDGLYSGGSVFKLTRSNGGWTYSSLHDFTGGSDGGAPEGSLILDGNGNLYGTTYQGGAYGSGVVFEITP
jgi:uncharacterized repeat protein (TIGR03803 family)